MKNSLKYLGLWQKKRNELHIDDDPQSDWLQMQALLNKQMPPVDNAPVNAPTGIKGLSTWTKLVIVLVTAAIIYSVYYLWSIEKQKHSNADKFHKENAIKPAGSTSQLIGDSSAAYTKSSDLKQSANTQNGRELNSDISNKDANGHSALVNAARDSTIKSNGRTAFGTLNKIRSELNNPSTGSLNNGFSGSHNKNGKALLLSQNAKAGQQTNIRRNYSAAGYDKSNRVIGNKSPHTLNGNQRVGGIALLSSGGNNKPSNAIGNGYSRGNGHIGHYGLNKPAGNPAVIISNSIKRTGRPLSHTNGKGRRTDDLTNGSSDIDHGDKRNENNNADSGGMALNTDDKTLTIGINQHYTDLVATNHGFDVTENKVKIIGGRPVSNRNIIPYIKAGKLPKAGSTKAKNINTASSKLNWGILIGTNSPGSFTPKSQNSNFYGSLPVDLFFGPFIAYNFSNKWAISSQLRLLNPQTVVNTYTHANASKVDSGQSLTITASRKMYSVSIPLYAVYKVTPNISIKVGPVINIPTKQINANSTLQPYSIRTDTAYYQKLKGKLDSTTYQQKLNYGLSGGVSIKVKRFVFEATYLKSLTGYQVTSGLGTAKSNNGTFQLSVGFQFK